jgi:hypothetical protein
VRPRPLLRHSINRLLVTCSPTTKPGDHFF